MRAAALAAVLVAWAGALLAQVPGVRQVRRPGDVPGAAGAPRTPVPAPAGRDTAGADTTAAGRGRGIPQRPSRRQPDERAQVRHMPLAVPLRQVLQDLIPSPLAEVHVNVREVRPLRRQESLEQ